MPYSDPEKRKAAARATAKRAYARDPEKFKARVAIWQAANPERVRANGRKRNGVVDPPGEMRAGLCEICDRPQAKLYLDHDHETGIVRGWLCLTCNTGLGKFQDSVSELQKAIDYLKKPR